MSPKYLNLLLLILSWVLYSYIVNPLYSGTESLLFPPSDSISTLTHTRDTYDKTIDAIPGLIAQSIAAKKQYESISADDKKNILVMVPVAVNDIKLMSELTNIGAATVPLDGMSIKDKGNGEYSVSFSIMTTYTNFKKVMAEWERSMRLFRLESVAFSPGKTEEEIIKFNVELSTYYMK